jgi:hypothetical protein
VRLHRALRALLLAASFGALAPLAQPAAADHHEEAADSPEDDRATAFRAVSGAPTEQVPGGPLLLAAYALVWVLLLLFVLRLAYLYASTRRDIDHLERRLREASSKAPPE